MNNLLAFLVRRPTRHTTRVRRAVDIPDEAPSTDAIFIVIRRMRAPLIFIITVFAISVLGLTLVPGRDEGGHTTHLSAFEAFYFTPTPPRRSGSARSTRSRRRNACG